MRSLLAVVSACPAPVGEGEGEGDVGEGEGEFDVEALVGSFDAVFVEGAVCGNGTPYLMGVSPGTDPTKTLVFFNGGGACWDAFSCYVANGAALIEATYSEELMRSELTTVLNVGLLTRDDDDPFRDATWLFLPYCTGDLFTGASERNYDQFQPQRLVHHGGAAIVDGVIDEVQARTPDVEQLWLFGISAGGYGATLNATRFADAFPDARVDVYADGSAFIPPLNLYGTWQGAWTMRLPEGCADCASDFGAVPRDVAAVVGARGGQLALSTAENDEVIAFFFGYGAVAAGATIAPQVHALLAADYDDDDHAAAYLAPGSVHVLLASANVVVDDVELREWFRRWTRGEPLPEVRFTP